MYISDCETRDVSCLSLPMTHYLRDLIHSVTHILAYTLPIACDRLGVILKTCVEIGQVNKRSSCEVKSGSLSVQECFESTVYFLHNGCSLIKYIGIRLKKQYLLLKKVRSRRQAPISLRPHPRGTVGTGYWNRPAVRRSFLLPQAFKPWV
jgi:hypothetical protein